MDYYKLAQCIRFCEVICYNLRKATYPESEPLLIEDYLVNWPKITK